MRPPPASLALLLIPLALTPPAPAQAQSGNQPAEQTRTTPTTTRPAPRANPVPVRLQSAPTRIDTLDLSFFLPEDAIAETTSFGANATMGVELPNSLGVLVIKGQRSTNNELTVKEVADSMVEQLQLARGVQDRDSGRFRSDATVIERNTISLSGLSGERFYIRLPADNQTPAMVRGVTVFNTEPGRFLVFDLMSEAKDFDAARPVYETVVGTMEVTDRDALAHRRAAAIENLQTVLAPLTPDRLRALAESNPERWERLSTPAGSGDDMDAAEHGYRRIRLRWGVRGEVSGKPESTWRAGDRVPGLIVKLDAMALESQLRIDTRATYFVSEDLNEEAWTVNMALRQGETTSESSITGARSGTSMTVQLQQSKMPVTVTRPVIQGDGYVSQALTHVLSAILIDHAKPGEFASYAYNPGTNTISMRWDTVEQPADKPGLWVIRSRADENTPATSHIFNAKGQLMRSELHNGRIWEPIELDRLVNLWRRKGLPLE